MDTETLKGRLLDKVVAGHGGCWVWTGGTDSHGYGVIWDGSRQVGAHRLAHELMVGPIPKGYEVDHTCRKTRCVRPDHLEAVTPRENWLRSNAISRRNMDKTHCLRGHPLEGENLRLQKEGGRVCRECERARQRTPESKRQRADRYWNRYKKDPDYLPKRNAQARRRRERARAIAQGKS